MRLVFWKFGGRGDELHIHTNLALMCTYVHMYVQTMKGFVHMEKEKFERLARQKQAQDEKLLKVMEMVAAPSPMRTPLGEKQTTRDVSNNDMFHSVVP